MKRIFASMLALVLPTSCGQVDATTDVKEEFFSVRLPGQWTALPRSEDRGLFVYESLVLGEHLTVSVFMATPPLGESEVESTFEEFVRTRRQAEVAEDPTIVLLDTKVERPGVGLGVTGFYQGRSSADRFVGNYTIVNSAGIANFYYEATKLPPQRFAERVLAILGDLSFVTPEN
jgi:hypothetical protein